VDGTGGRSTERAGPHVLPASPSVPRRGLLLVPAFWLLLGLLAAGGWRIVQLLNGPIAGYPGPALFAIILFGLYAVPFVLVVRAFDFLEREPPALLCAAFAWGGLVATATAAAGDSAANDLLAKQVSPAFASQWGSALIAPTLEEPVKLLGVVMIVLVAGDQVNSIVDGFTYGAFVGLGFQVIEDLIFALAQVARDAGEGAYPAVFAQFLLRGFIGGLWSHTAFTALAGAGVGYLVVRRERPWPVRLTVAGLALAAAWALHFLWNTPWLVDGFGAGGWGVLAVLVLKGLPAVVLVLVLAALAGRQEAGAYLQLLAAEPDPDVSTPRERAALASIWGRRAARRYALDRSGRRAAREVRYLQRVQARLAVELSRGGPDAPRYRQLARDCRAGLRRLGHPEAVAPTGAVPPGWFIALLALTAAGLCVLFALIAVGAGVG
jgi:protease PrsW